MLLSGVVPWCRGSVVPWCRGAVVPWCRGSACIVPTYVYKHVSACGLIAQGSCVRILHLSQQSTIGEGGNGEPSHNIYFPRKRTQIPISGFCYARNRICDAITMEPVVSDPQRLLKDRSKKLLKKNILQSTVLKLKRTLKLLKIIMIY